MYFLKAHHHYQNNLLDNPLKRHIHNTRYVGKWQLMGQTCEISSKGECQLSSNILI